MQDIDVVRVKARVWNWGRWARSDSGCNGHCASAEHRYVPPRPDDLALERHASQPIDVADAERVEQAIKHIRFALDRTFLVMLYAEGRPQQEICRKLRILQPLFEAFHQRVLGGVAYELECVDGRALARTRARVYNPSHNLIPPAGCVGSR